MDTQNGPVGNTMPEPMKKAPSYGGLIAVLIILVAVVVGAFYFWGERVAKESAMMNDLDALETQGDSTDAAAIEADLNAQSPDEFDTDFDKAFSELDAAFDEGQ